MDSHGNKVLIIVQNLPVPFDRRVWLEALALNEAGYQVSIISPKGKKGSFKESFIVQDQINIYRYPAPPEAHGIIGYFIEFGYCWIMTAILSIIIAFRHGFDIIQACNPPDTYFLLAWIYKVLSGKKFIFDHHDLSPDMYIAKGGKKEGFLHKSLLFLERMTFKTADIVITTNESHKSIAINRGEVEEENIFIVRSGPDFDRLKILPSEKALKNGFEYLACYLGEMCSQDGVDYLLRSIQTYIFGYGRNDTYFVLMGGGPELEKMKALRDDLNLKTYVRFTGRVSDHDLCRYLSTADVCLDPDPYTEWSDKSTMNKIMEYMTFGKPIVAFNLTENRFSAKTAAVYVTPNDEKEFAKAIIALIESPEQRQEMGKTGKNRVHQALAWPFSIPNLLNAYEKVLEPDNSI